MMFAKIQIRKLKERFAADLGRAEVEPGDDVLLSTDNGLEVGSVLEVYAEEKKKTDIRIIRKLNENDYKIIEENDELSRKIFPEVKEEIEKEKIVLNLTYVQYTYDKQKLYIYYTADSRVDFRNLIRVLGSKYKTRIQMVQIGVRDKAAIIGGLGICGLETCCKGFMHEIESVNIDMARTQQLPINPESVTGCCGRLLCCLRYENEYYEQLEKDFPKIGKKVNTPNGGGTVVDLNIIKGTVTVKMEAGTVITYPYKDVKLIAAVNGVKNKIKKWIK